MKCHDRLGLDNSTHYLLWECRPREFKVCLISGLPHTHTSSVINQGLAIRFLDNTLHSSLVTCLIWSPWCPHCLGSSVICAYCVFTIFFYWMWFHHFLVHINSHPSWFSVDEKIRPWSPITAKSIHIAPWWLVTHPPSKFTQSSSIVWVQENCGSEGRVFLCIHSVSFVFICLFIPCFYSGAIYI